MRVIWLTTLIFLSLRVMANPVDLENVRIWAAPDNTRIVFDIANRVEHKLEKLSDPHRVVLDIRNARLKNSPAQPVAADKYLKEVRSAMRNPDDLRVVLDLKQDVRVKSFLLPPNQQYGHRLVIDLYSAEEQQEIQTASINKFPGALRDVVIAIDPGHGGEDPGARGPSGMYEKEIVLQISKRLAEMINKERGMRAVLTREGDYFLPLRRRMQIARQNKADLFISIHADAFRDPRVSGSSVYILSQRGASSEAARWLAERENASDLIGGVNLDVKNDNMLASVLLDLSQTASLEMSIDVADRVLVGLKNVGKVHKRQVQSAGFAVLKSPDVPSILVETAYISNPEEERKLRDRNYQTQLATAILQGLRNYFNEYAPEGTMLAMNVSRKHVITRGDTLSAIAQQYRISMRRLREHNNLKTDVIRVGQVLSIPSDS